MIFVFALSFNSSNMKGAMLRFLIIFVDMQVTNIKNTALKD